jgi:hypothetical protein
VVVSAAEREQLARATVNRPRKYVERARIVLALADRQPAQDIGVSRPTDRQASRKAPIASSMKRKRWAGEP